MVTSLRFLALTVKAIENRAEPLSQTPRSEKRSFKRLLTCVT